MLEEELQRPPEHESTASVQQNSFLPGKPGARVKPGDDLDLSFLPDELSRQDEQSSRRGAESLEGSSVLFFFLIPIVSLRAEGGN